MRRFVIDTFARKTQTSHYTVYACYNLYTRPMQQPFYSKLQNTTFSGVKNEGIDDTLTPKEETFLRGRKRTAELEAVDSVSHTLLFFRSKSQH